MANVATKVGPAVTSDANKRRLLGRLALAAAALAALIMLGRELGGYLPGFAAWIDSLGILGPVVFISGYIIATVAFVPGALLTLAAGATFGIVKGTVYVFLGATVGSSAAFLVSRHVARGAVERRLASHPRFAAIDRAVGSAGRKIVLLLRLSPVFPFNLLNYGLGLTNVSFTDYVMASVGMLPGTLLYVYYGKLAGDVASMAGGAAVERGAAYYAVLVLGLAATVIVTTIVTRTARRALREATGE